MERPFTNRNKWTLRLLAGGLALGGAVTGLAASESPSPPGHYISGETFTFPDDTVCVGGVYETAGGFRLAPDGGCAQNTNLLTDAAATLIR